MAIKNGVINIQAAGYNGALTLFRTSFTKLHNHNDINTCVVNTQNSNSLDLNLPAAFQQKMPLTCKT